MVFSRIQQSINNIDYAWNKPQSYLALIPGISLLIQKIQLAKILPLINNMHPPKIDDSSQEKGISKDEGIVRKYSNLSKWHVRGSLISLIASIALINIYPLVTFIGAGLSLFQMINILRANCSHSVVQHNDVHGNYKLELVGFVI